MFKKNTIIALKSHILVLQNSDASKRCEQNGNSGDPEQTAPLEWE